MCPKPAPTSREIKTVYEAKRGTQLADGNYQSFEEFVSYRSKEEVLLVI